MYKEFQSSTEIVYEDLKNNLHMDLIFAHDDISGELYVFKRYINDEYSLDEYETVYGIFQLLEHGKERFDANEFLNRMKEYKDLIIKVWKKEENQ